jgi:hypothetical protein
MKREAQTRKSFKSARRIVSAALTWDGARWPVRTLPPKCRAFLAGSARKPASRAKDTLARLFARDDVDEIRICWVPRLKGGDDVLAAPFPAPGNERLHFQFVRQVRLGDNLGVVYQPCKQPRR